MKKYQQIGFTLLEAMMVIAILGILTAISIPFYGRLLEPNILKDASNRWLNSYYLAQKQALHLQKNIILCASNNGINCTDNTEFTSGWIVGYCQKEEFKVIQDNPPLNYGKITANFSGMKNLISDCNYQSNSAIGIQFLTNGKLPLNFNSGSMLFTSTQGNRDEKLVINISSTGKIESKLIR